jgi:hypothetical protein
VKVLSRNFHGGTEENGSRFAYLEYNQEPPEYKSRALTIIIKLKYPSLLSPDKQQCKVGYDSV